MKRFNPEFSAPSTLFLAALVVLLVLLIIVPSDSLVSAVADLLDRIDIWEALWTALVLTGCVMAVLTFVLFQRAVRNGNGQTRVRLQVVLGLLLSLALCGIGASRALFHRYDKLESENARLKLLNEQLIRTSSQRSWAAISEADLRAHQCEAQLNDVFGDFVEAREQLAQLSYALTLREREFCLESVEYRAAMRERLK
ncbi:MAG: hypothetical protein GY906_14540 [bacterium]|nr:hypothetical protein [bacterium]